MTAYNWCTTYEIHDRAWEAVLTAGTRKQAERSCPCNGVAYIAGGFGSWLLTHRRPTVIDSISVMQTLALWETALSAHWLAHQHVSERDGEVTRFWCLGCSCSQMMPFSVRALWKCNKWISTWNRPMVSRLLYTNGCEKIYKMLEFKINYKINWTVCSFIRRSLFCGKAIVKSSGFGSPPQRTE